DKTMNGALAIADVLGIYGREGVDMAAYWTSPSPMSPGAQAFSMYTNYDGAGHGFGDRALAARSSATDYVTCYASVDSSSGDIIVIALNKSPDTVLPATLQLNVPVANSARMFRLAQDHPDSIENVGEADVSGSTVHINLAPYSVNLVRLR